MIDAHENRHKFFNLPRRPERLKAHAMEVCLVNSHEGHLVGLANEKLTSLASFQDVEWKVKVGEHIPITIDFITSPAAVMFMHHDREVVEREQEIIHSTEGLMDVKRIAVNHL